MRRRAAALAWALAVSGCAQVQVASHLFKKAQDHCTAEGAVKVGNPYLVDGVRYQPLPSSLGYQEKGIASWYGADFHGKASANGECYNMYAFTAAHKTLPLPTVVRVTNLENNRSIVVKVNDRGPFVRGRILDLSYAAAQSLDVVRHGTAPVLVEAIGGPHHRAGGYQGGAARLAGQAAPGPGERAETLPSVVPTTAGEEDLAPAAYPAQAAGQAVPPPATENLPKPPPYEERVFTDTQPLTRTQVFVQVGAYAAGAGAQGQQQRLLALYPTARVTAVEVGGRTLHRVRAGPFRSLADAEAALDRIVAAGFSGAQIKVED